MSRTALALAVALLLAACGRGGNVECGATTNASGIEAGATWGPADLPLLRIRDGVLERGGFDGRPWVAMPDHRFAMQSADADMSRDARWLLYSGPSDDERTEYWLHDVTAGTERLVLTRPRWDFAMAEFSPDGRTIVLYSNYDERDADVEGIGLYFIDVASGKATHAGRPPDVAPRQWGWGHARWSNDGSHVILEFTNPDVAFRIAPTDGAFAPTPAVHREGVEEPPSYPGKQGVPPYTEGGGMRRTADGEWTAELGYGWKAAIFGKSEIEIRDRYGDERVVAAGGFNECEGSTLRVTAWAGHFLLFQRENRWYLHDADRNRTRSFDAELAGSTHFLWPGVDTLGLAPE